MTHKISIKNVSTNALPDYATRKSAGIDLRANVRNGEILTLLPMQRMLVSTGLSISLPTGLEAQIRPRSGLAFKNGITVLNSPGTIDADYRGEIGVLLINLSDTLFEIRNGDRIAQMVIASHETADWNLVEELDSTDRGEKGFGSTGTK